MALPAHLQSKVTPAFQTAPLVAPLIVPMEPAKPTSLVTPGSVMLMGPTGSAKTDALLSYVEAGIELFVASTEANGPETLIRSARRRGVDMSRVHWRHCRPTNMNMATMIASADQLNRKAVGDMQKVDSPAILEKSKYRTYINLLETIQNFRCDRTGQTYGDVTEWGDDRAFVIDSLSGLNLMMTQLQIGNRGTLTLPDYNVCQISLEQLIVTLCSCRCFFALTAHVELERDAVSGRIKVMASTIGQKLAPKLPIHFSDVVRARREGGKWYWATEDEEAELKARSLPWSNKLEPTFVPVVEAYRRDKEFAKQQEEVPALSD